MRREEDFHGCLTEVCLLAEQQIMLPAAIQALEKCTLFLCRPNKVFSVLIAFLICELKLNRDTWRLTGKDDKVDKVLRKPHLPIEQHKISPRFTQLKQLQSRLCNIFAGLQYQGTYFPQRRARTTWFRNQWERIFYQLQTKALCSSIGWVWQEEYWC